MKKNGSYFLRIIPDFDILCGILTSCAERIAGGTEKTYNKINYEPWNGLKFCKYNPKKTCHKGGNEYEKEKMV